MSNPSTDTAPIVGLVMLPPGKEFQESKLFTYHYETIGGNNSQVSPGKEFQESKLFTYPYKTIGGNNSCQ